MTATVTAPLTINLTNRGRKWNLNNVVFNDGGTANGYFVYDPATGQYLAVNIQVTHAIPDDPNNPLGHAPEDLYYYPWPNGFNADVRRQLEHGIPDVTAKPGDFRPGHSTIVDAAAIQFRTGAYERGRDNSPGRSIPTCRIPRTAPKTLRRRARRRRRTFLKSSSRCPTTPLGSRQPGTTASSSAGA